MAKLPDPIAANPCGQRRLAFFMRDYCAHDLARYSGGSFYPLTACLFRLWYNRSVCGEGCTPSEIDSILFKRW